MFNFNKKSEKEEIKFVSNKIYKDKFDIVYKNGEVESFYGESNFMFGLYTKVDDKVLKIFEHKLPCVVNKTYLRNISEIDYIKNYETEILEDNKNV
jgi:hypothetical protein